MGEARRGDLQSKVAELHERLAEGVAELTTTEAWTAWLDTAKRFHRYSFGNQVLILAQRPDATQVAGYKAWQALGRQVRKGEKAIRILAPRPGRCWPCGGTGDDCDRCGGSGRFLTFTIASVFDVSQTDGEPVVDATSLVTVLAGEGSDALAGALRAVAVAEGFAVDYRSRDDDYNLRDGTNGYCDFTSRRIVVGGELPPAQRTKTLCHEVAHALMHKGEHNRPRGRVETEAESVAYIVCGAYGLDTADYSFGYVGSWGGERSVEAIRKTGERVQKTASALIDRVMREYAERGLAADEADALVLVA